MRKMIHSVLLVTALVAMTSCTANEDNAVHVDQSAIDGTWYTNVAMTGQTYDMRSVDDLVEVTYDHIAVVLDMSSGFGKWTHYYLKDGELVNYEGYYFSSFSYVLDRHGDISLTPETEISDTSPILGLRLRYTGGKIVVGGNMNIEFSVPSQEEKEKLGHWNTTIDADHLGFEADELETDLNPNNATEPARVRK